MELNGGILDSTKNESCSNRQQRNIDDPHVAMMAKCRSFKLLSDPFITKGAQKVYRYDGIVPGDTSQPPVIARDPRKSIARIRPRMEVELAIPR